MEKATFALNHESEALSLLEALVQIPSPTGKEAARASFLENYLKEKGVENLFSDKAGNLVCSFGKGEDGYTVFAAHLDTVFPDESITLRKEENLWYAPGIGDDSANVVNLVEGILYAKDHWHEGCPSLLFVFNTGEEGLGNLKGTRELFHSYEGRIRQFLSFDLYAPHVYHRPVGSHRYAITLKTKGGHSYNDFGEANAILEAAKLITALSNAPLTEDTTWNFGTIAGGNSINAIASSCVFLYEYRSTRNVSLLAMEEFLLKTLEEYRTNSVSIFLEELGRRPAMGDVDEEALKRLENLVVEKMKKVYGVEPVLGPLSSDSNIPLSLGIPAMTVGSIYGGDCHRASEWIDATSMKKGILLVISLVDAFLK